MAEAGTSGMETSTLPATAGSVTRNGAGVSIGRGIETSATASSVTIGADAVSAMGIDTATRGGWASLAAICGAAVGNQVRGRTCGISDAERAGRLAAIVVSAEDSSQADAIARRIGHAAPKVDGMAVFGPAPAPLAMLRGRHRQRLLVHAARSLDVQDVIRDWLADIDWSAKVRVSVDVDPYSFL